MWGWFRNKEVGTTGPRTVLLFDYDNAITVSKVVKGQAGYIAHRHSKPVLLHRDGTVTHSYVEKWLPHTGWDGSEFEGEGSKC